MDYGVLDFTKDLWRHRPSWTVPVHLVMHSRRSFFGLIAIAPVAAMVPAISAAAMPDIELIARREVMKATPLSDSTIEILLPYARERCGCLKLGPDRETFAHYEIDHATGAVVEISCSEYAPQRERVLSALADI